MRVLISTWAWRSHYYPMVPLAWALLAAGHEVRVAGPPVLLPVIAGSGVPAVAVVSDLDVTEILTRMIEAVEPDGATSDGMRGITTADSGVVRYAAAVVDDLVAFGRFWRPHLVVHEPFNLAGAVAAQVLGVPVVKHLWAADLTEMVPIGEAVATGDLVRRFGVERLRPDSDLVLDPCPPAMQVPPGVSPRQPIRFVPYNGPAELPPWLRTRPERRRVCVTSGTLVPRTNRDDLFLAPRVAEALSALDAEIVVATDPRAHARFATLPGNVRLTQTPLALHLLLPGCAAVVHQGGAGTTMTALAAGVPQLILPRMLDQLFNARQLAVTGAGRIGDLAAIRDQVHQLLTEPAWGEAAADVARQNRARPSPAQVVDELPKLLDG